jgi:hypothetical protein
MLWGQPMSDPARHVSEPISQLNALKLSGVLANGRRNSLDLDKHGSACLLGV